MPAPDNPFTLVYDALWRLVQQNPAFTESVPEGNRIRYDNPFDRSPVKKNVGAADLPELVLVADTLSANIHATSSSSKVVRQYKWMMATGDFRYSEFLAQLEWQVFTAMCDWQSTLAALCWREKTFVKRADLLSGAAGVSDLNLNRGIAGWSAIWRVELEMHFQTSDLYRELVR